MIIDIKFIQFGKVRKYVRMFVKQRRTVFNNVVACNTPHASSSRLHLSDSNNSGGPSIFLVVDSSKRYIKPLRKRDFFSQVPVCNLLLGAIVTECNKIFKIALGVCNFTRPHSRTFTSTTKNV